MSTPPENTNAAAAQSEPSPASEQKSGWLSMLPFGGKWTGGLFLIMLAIAAVVAVAELSLSCVLAMSIPPIICTSFGENIGIPEPAKTLYAIASGFVLLCFAVSLLWFMASSVYRWVHGLPKRGGLAILLLIIIVAVDLIVRGIFTSYANSTLDTITNVSGVFMIVWIFASLGIKTWQNTKASAKESVNDTMATLANKITAPFKLLSPFKLFSRAEKGKKKDNGDKEASAKDTTVTDASNTATKQQEAEKPEGGETPEEPKVVLSTTNEDTKEERADSTNKEKGWIRRTFEEQYDKAKDAVGKGINEAKTKGKDVATFVSDKATEKWKQASSAADEAKDSAAKKITPILQSAKETGSDAVKGASNKLGIFGTRAKEFLTRKRKESDKNDKP